MADDAGTRREHQGLRSRLVRTIWATTALVTIAVGTAAAYLGRYVADNALLLASTVALVTAAMLASRIVLSREAASAFEPLDRLRDAMRRLADREFGVRLEETGPLDFATLAEQFNISATRLQQRHVDDAASKRALASDFEQQAVALRRARQQLGDLDDAKEAFLSNISHEIRTPLTSVIAAVEILQNFTDDDVMARSEFVQIIDRESRRLLLLLDSVLDFAEARSDEIELDIRAYDLRDIMSAAIETTLGRRHDDAEGSRVRTDFTHAGRAPVIQCDRTRIECVLVNILDNAFKFSPAGEPIDIQMGPADDIAGYAIRVKDQGPGVPPEHRTRLFRGFGFRTSVLTDKPKGVGVGLALSAAIVRAHGGTIRFEERPYRGSCFVVELPQRPPGAADELAEPDVETDVSPLAEVATASATSG